MRVARREAGAEVSRRKRRKFEGRGAAVARDEAGRPRRLRRAREAGLSWEEKAMLRQGRVGEGDDEPVQNLA